MQAKPSVRRCVLLLCAAVTSVTVAAPARGAGDTGATLDREGGALRTAGAQPSPAEELLLVTANLQEAYGEDDLDDLREMDVFTKRLLRSTPYEPDALLLQEVRDTSAGRVARNLSVATGSTYRVVVDPGPEPWRRGATKTIHTETAIVINKDTMSKVGAGGFIRTSYSRRQAAPGGVPEVKRHAYALLEERSTGWRLPMTSLHFTLTNRLASVDVAEAKKRAWSVKIDEILRAEFPRSASRVVGGDFNAGRCVSAKGDCEIAPFWNALTGTYRDYQEAVWATVAEPGVDHIFTRGGTLSAYVDEYDADAARGTSAYYSDHRFRWALLSPDGTPPSTPADLRGRSGNVDIRLSWAPASDVGTGVARYEIWRGQSVSEARLRDTTTNTLWTDTSTYRGMSYVYFVVAVDRAHNRSAPSPPIEVDAYAS